MSRPGASLSQAATARLDDYPVDMAWSADQRRVAIAGGEGKLYTVDVNGAVLQVGSQPPGLLAVQCLAQGSTIITAGQDGSVRSWDYTEPARSNATALFQGRGWPAGLCQETRGRRLAFAMGRVLHVIDAEGTPQHALGEHDSNLTHIVWRGPDELLTAGNGAFYVEQLGSATMTTRYGLEGAPMTLAMSPDRRVVASGLQDGTVVFRNLITLKKSRMSGYDGKVLQTSWSANSRYLATAASASATIVVWDFSGKGPEGTEPLELTGHTDRVECVAFAPEGPYLVSGGRDQRLILWRPGPRGRDGTSALPVDVQVLAAPVERISWSRSARQLAVALSDGSVSFFSISA